MACDKENVFTVYFGCLLACLLVLVCGTRHCVVLVPLPEGLRIAVCMSKRSAWLGWVGLGWVAGIELLALRIGKKCEVYNRPTDPTEPSFVGRPLNIDSTTIWAASASASLSLVTS
jgi:hypothetical protein